jgi:glycosyltransferase involved in cell wall biosynthesis
MIGGIGRHVVELAGRLSLANDVTIIHGYRPAKEEAPIRSGPAELQAVKTIPLAIRGPGVVGLSSFYSRAFAIAGELCDHLDVIHVHGLHAPIPRRISSKVILTVHTTYCGKSAAYRDATEKGGALFANGVEIGRIACELLYSEAMSCRECLVLRSAPRLIAISPSVREEVEWYGLKARLVPLAMDAARPSPVSVPDRPSFSILSVGRLIERKAFPLLIRSAIYLRDVDPGVQIHIAGGGREFSALENLIEKNSLRKNVKLLGEVSNAALIQEYDSCDVYVQPSIYEGLPMTLVQGMSYGKPVVVVDAGYSRGLASLGEFGRVSSAAPKALAEAVLEVMSDPALRIASAINSYKFFANTFSWDRVLPSLLKEYESVAA